MTGLVILLVVLILPLIWFMGTYNGLVRIRNHCHESWSNIDTELKRRHNLIPNLVRTVEGYAKHERELLESVTRARTSAEEIQTDAKAQSDKENRLVEEVSRLLIRVEAYPELKSDRGFLELQEELIRTEDRIQYVRRIFNANVRDYNNRVEMFPSSLVAGMSGFAVKSYFEVTNLNVRQAPDVSGLSD